MMFEVHRHKMRYFDDLGCIKCAEWINLGPKIVQSFRFH